jgi:hypothetical protein
MGSSAAETRKRGLVVLYDDSLLHALILNSNSNDEASEHRTELDPPETESNLQATSQLVRRVNSSFNLIVFWYIIVILKE